MCENVGGYDRALRIIVGTVILLITLMASSWWGLVGLIPLLTEHLAIARCIRF